jgi:hypothetical protein
MKVWSSSSGQMEGQNENNAMKYVRMSCFLIIFICGGSFCFFDNFVLAADGFESEKLKVIAAFMQFPSC